MTDEFTDLEEAVRQRLVRSSVDVHEVDALRSRVLAALEKEDAVLPTRVPSFWTRGKRPAALLIGAAAAIAAAAVFLPQQPDQTLIIAAGEPSDAEAVADETAPLIGRSDNSAADIRDSLALGQPEEALGTWVVRTEDEHVLTLEFVPDNGQPDAPGQFLRIIAPPSATTAVEIVDSLTSSLFDTVVVDDAASRIGGLESRELRLETVRGTSRLGFKIAADTYFETEGIDRVFVVHITTARPQTSVFWLEAGPEHMDEFEKIASRHIESLIGD